MDPKIKSKIKFGYMGKILIVDLSSGKINEKEIPDKIYEKYLSGVGLGLHYLYENIPANADPMGPDNILGFVSGLLTGCGSLFTGRWMVVGKSPLTGTWGDANCGGNFSPAIKNCGYDGIFFKGISKKPVYLYIDDNVKQLRDASYLWGKDAVETENILLKEANSSKARVACIGQSGENLSLISGICNDLGRIAARSGLGAVMGSKKLKALLLSGNQKIDYYDKAKINKLNKKCNFFVNMQPPFVPGDKTSYLGDILRISPYQMAQDGFLYKILLKKWGTVGMNQISIETGDAPVKNWKGTNKDFSRKKSIKVNPDVFTKCEISKYYCYSCPLGCGGICSIEGKKYKKTHKPEYETVTALGALCMNEDVDSIFYLNEVLNRAGMDSISAGASVAFAIDCFENGLIDTKDTDGIELTWGNTGAIIQIIEKMVTRDGFGDVLADGVKKAAEKIGKNSEKFAINSGGQELPMHDGRNDPGFALHYYVEPTPGRHTLGSQMYYEMFKLWKIIKDLPKPDPLYDKDNKYIADELQAIKAAACSKFMNIANGIGLCLFGALLGLNRIPVFEWLNATTGWELTPVDYMKIGENIQTLKQAFNIKHGINPKKLKPSKQTLGKLNDGANKDRTFDLEKMAQNYWQQFGWSKKTGKPLKKTLKKLGIE